MADLPDFATECFFIAPIGKEGDEIRKRSDNILDHIITPAVAELDLIPVRADRVAKPGQITHQVIQHALRARAAVADLTGSNANVYYELAVRHSARLPVVLIAEEGQILPFDISNMRTIFFDPHDLGSAARCREQVTIHLREALDGEVGSPISITLELEQLAQGTPVEKTVAELATQVERIGQQIQELSNRVPRYGPARQFTYKRGQRRYLPEDFRSTALRGETGVLHKVEPVPNEDLPRFEQYVEEGTLEDDPADSTPGTDEEPSGDE